MTFDGQMPEDLEIAKHALAVDFQMAAEVLRHLPQSAIQIQ